MRSTPKVEELGSAHVTIYDSSGNEITAFASGTVIGSGTGTQAQTNATATGAGTALDVTGTNYLVCNVRGITTATITFQASTDDTNWDDVYAAQMGTFMIGTTAIANGNYVVAVAGYKSFRANITAYTSGTINVTTRTNIASGYQQVFAYLVNQLSFEDPTNGIARIQEKKVLAATNVALTSSSLYGDVDVLAKNSAGNVYSVTACNLNAAIRYLQIHNRTTAPSNPNVPAISIPMVQNEKIVLGEDFFGTTGVYFDTGIAWGFSTTAATFTAATTTDHFGFLRYI